MDFPRSPSWVSPQKFPGKKCPNTIDILPSESPIFPFWGQNMRVLLLSAPVAVPFGFANQTPDRPVQTPA